MQAAKERTHAETTRRECFKLKIILIFRHHIQIIVTRIFNRIRKVTHMTRDIHDIPPSFRFRFSSERILFQLARPYSIFEHEPQFGHTSKRIDIHSDGRGRLDTFQAHTVCRVLFRKEIEPSC